MIKFNLEDSEGNFIATDLEGDLAADYLYGERLQPGDKIVAFEDDEDDE